MYMERPGLGNVNTPFSVWKQRGSSAYVLTMTIDYREFHGRVDPLFYGEWIVQSESPYYCMIRVQPHQLRDYYRLSWARTPRQLKEHYEDAIDAISARGPLFHPEAAAAICDEAGRAQSEAVAPQAPRVRMPRERRS